MAVAEKILQVVFYQRHCDLAGSWRDTTDWSQIDALLRRLQAELLAFDVDLQVVKTEDVIVVRGYADVLNSVRLRCPSAGFGNSCLGHIIGRSANCDLCADLERGINRLLFAPETIEPQGSDKIVCHNCGCGC
jgi:hypothetical protein